MITNWTKLGLIPSDAEFFNVIENGVYADYSSHARHLTVASNYPHIIANVAGKNSAYYFDGTKNPLSNSTAILLKHFFIIAKFDGTQFDGFNGLLSDNVDIPIHVGGGNTTTVFYNFSQGISYRKNNAAFAESAKAAPMNAWGLLEVQMPDGLPMQGYQIGRDRNNDTRNWKGWYGEDSSFSRILSTNERRAAIFYYNLKWGSYFGNPITLEFPDPTITGIYNYRFDELPSDAGEITVSHTYQDRGKSFNRLSENPPMHWEIELTGLSYDEMRIFDEFNNRVGEDISFDFTDKWGEKHSGVRVEKYNRTHEGHKSKIYSVSFKLAKLP